MKFTTFRKLRLLMMMSLTARLIKRSTHVDEEAEGEEEEKEKEDEEEEEEEEEKHIRRLNNPHGGQ